MQAIKSNVLQQHKTQTNGSIPRVYLYTGFFSSLHCLPSPSSPLVASNLRRPCHQVKLARAGPNHRCPSSSSIAGRTQPAIHYPHPHLDFACTGPDYRHPP
ncbi:hypothetical protein D1007_20178 [Hordeum vulgare]|nr:hypothetical protein D1007_20178 [Hordeum vulgare]